MTRHDLDRAWLAFSVAFTSNAHLPADERGPAAMRAAFHALNPDELAEERARQIVERIAAKHDTTSVDIRRPCRVANVVAAREEAAYELTRAGFSRRDVARLLGRTSPTHVRFWIEGHEARVGAMGGAGQMEQAYK